jgi:tetratricopeptide (TPR) repeat protein
MKRKFWIQAAVGCLAALGMIGYGFGDDKGRSGGGGKQSDKGGKQAGGGSKQSDGAGKQAGSGDKSSGGRGTIHTPPRSGGNREPATTRGQSPSINRTPAFTPPKVSGPRGDKAAPQTNRKPDSRPQVGKDDGQPGVGRPGVGVGKPGIDVGKPGVGVGKPGVVRPDVGKPGVGLEGSPRTNVGERNNVNVGSGKTNNINRAGNTNRVGKTRVGSSNQSLGGTSINLGSRSINLAASGYQPAYYGHSAYHGYWNGNYGTNKWGYGPAYAAGYNAGYNSAYPYAYYRPLGWGLGAWGLGALAYNSGYLGYANPYYNGYPGYNYAQPIPVLYSVPSAGSANTADEVLNAAIAAFQQNDFDQALDLVNQGITQSPNDSVLHEFRALVLFAKADYQQAAATIHSVLAVGPGWNWTTLSSMYGNVAVYTAQLRALEKAVRSHPDDGAERFLLAYHYLIGGHSEAAARHLQQVVTLVPTDRVAADLLRMISPSKADQPTEAPPQPAGETASAAKPVDPATLVGTWAAARDDGSKFALSLTNDETFTWKFSQKGQESQELAGKYTVEGHVLALEGTDGGSLIANVTPGAGKKFNFKLLGAPAEDPGLDFSR